MTINTYAPSDVELLIDSYKVHGWENITIVKDTENYALIRGIRGKNTRVRNYNKSCMITLDLIQTSEVNDILNKIHSKDIVVPDGDISTENNARIMIGLKDKSGTSRFQSDDAYIVSYPDLTFNQDFSTRTWKIQCLSYQILEVGGNLRPVAPLSASIFNNLF